MTLCPALRFLRRVWGASERHTLCPTKQAFAAPTWVVTPGIRRCSKAHTDCTTPWFSSRESHKPLPPASLFRSLLCILPDPLSTLLHFRPASSLLPHFSLFSLRATKLAVMPPTLAFSFLKATGKGSASTEFTMADQLPKSLYRDATRLLSASTWALHPTGQAQPPIAPGPYGWE